MNFKESKAIYLQIADRICDEILLGQYPEEERIPSVREYAAIVEVNANTVMRSFDYLQVQNIIYNKRGIGYFVASGAKELIHSLRKDTFLKEELDYFFRQLYTLDIPIKEIETMYHEFIKSRNRIKTKYYETYYLYIYRTSRFRIDCNCGNYYFHIYVGEALPGRWSLLGNEQVKMDLNGVHVIKVFTSQDGVSEARRVFISGEMKIGSTAASSGKEQVSYPKGDYLNVTQKNDTLFMKLDFNVNNIPEKYRDRDYIFVSGFDVSLAVDSLTGIVTGEEGLKLNLIGIETDSLFVRGNRYNISLDSCRLGSCDIQGNGLDFHAKDSKIENFYLNLDGVWRWTFENTEVGTEYLSGSNQHSNDLQKGECKRVVWTPLTEDARLQVNVREKAEITITPE